MRVRGEGVEKECQVCAAALGTHSSFRYCYAYIQCAAHIYAQEAYRCARAQKRRQQSRTASPRPPPPLSAPLSDEEEEEDGSDAEGVEVGGRKPMSCRSAYAMRGTLGGVCIRQHISVYMRGYAIMEADI